MSDQNIHLDQLLGASSGSIYAVTILAAKRAIHLTDGDKPLIEKPSEKVLDNALREIKEGKVKVQVKK